MLHETGPLEGRIQKLTEDEALAAYQLQGLSLGGLISYIDICIYIYPDTPCMPYMPTLTPQTTPTDRQSYGSPMGRVWDIYIYIERERGDSPK